MPWEPSRLARWVAEQATASDDRDALIEGFCGALAVAGLPLWRLSVSIPAIDPTERGFAFNWVDGEGVAFVPTGHGVENEAAWLRSPIYALIQEDRSFARWRLDELASDAFAILHDLRAGGGTDYVLFIIAFAPGTALRGVAVSFTTTDPAGFRDQDIAALGEVLPALGLAICKLSLGQTLRETLGTYLGRSTGARVLDGQIRRGEGRTVSAAILLADLRGFTALSDRADAMRMVGWLDEHFDALGEPVMANGGEILKFLGDGFLAIFPVSDPAAHPCPTCRIALAAARQALKANSALNARRRTAGLPALDADVVLHFGEVVYGNVGTSRRLDFTVIGRAVNEASRIETLCEELGHPLLLSDTFAARCAAGLQSVGTFPLRGLDRQQRLWTVPDDSN